MICSVITPRIQPTDTMAQDNKPRVVTSFDKISQELQEQIKLTYPFGFSEELIRFTNKDGESVSALRFESDEKIYLIKMTATKARQLIEDDDDYEDGVLRSEVKEDYEDRYSDLDYMPDADDD